MDDQSIVQLFWDRNESAINEVSARYGSYCRKIAMNILGNDEDSKECINDAYLNLWNSIPPQRPNSLPAYLGKITRNIALNMYKKNSAEKRGGSQMTIVFDELSEIAVSETFIENSENDLAEYINDFLSTLNA